MATPEKSHAIAPAVAKPKPARALTAAQTPHSAVASKPAASGTAATLTNLRRIPSTVDPLGSSAAGLQTSLNPFRLAATSKVFGGLSQIRLNIGTIMQELQQPKLPAVLVGALHQPDGSTAAARVQIQFQPSSVGKTGAVVTVITADNGSFTLNMPSGALVPEAGLTLTVHGANTNTTVSITAAQIAANGMVGVLTLPVNLTPLPVSIMAALQALTPPGSPVPGAPPTPAQPSQKHAVTIGEAGSVCVQTFAASSKVDSFPWGIFFRLIEPQMSIATETQEVPATGAKFNWMTIYKTDPKTDSGTSSKFVDRAPIDQPLSVDGFRDQIAGLDTSGSFTQDELVPTAASLGLGYVLQMAQQWSFQGLGLGDLVYSLPLAPGEQQQMAVFERQDTTAVQESEFFSQSEVMNQAAMSDTSTTATFASAFNELVNGNSAFSTDSSSGSFGVSILGIGGGSGSSSSSGTSSTSLAGSRDTTAQAVQATQSSAENSASARVTANRTGMRMATATENMGVTTKIITNHNHNHALTMQYWEVLRMYDVTTVIEGLTMVCLIPMQIVRFMPPGQPAKLSDPSTVDSHAKVLARYGNILTHLDVLQRFVPRRFQHGLNLLAQFAADPTTVVDPSGSSAETVINFKLGGNFLSCETLSVVAVTKRNTRVGPVQLSPSVAGQPPQIPQDTFMTQDELVAWLTAERQINSTTLTGSLALPPSINRSDIIGFEVSRQFMTVRYTLTSAAKQAFEQALSQEAHGQQVTVSSPFGALFTSFGPAFLNPPTITLTPRDLEPLLGGPTLTGFYAAVENFDQAGKDQPSPQETYANDDLAGTVLPPQPFPVPALQVAPVLRYQDVLEIEKAAQHIVRNTTRYSRALWMSMTPEESVILLDGYTIGVPSDGLEDASQMIPLMNCLQNVILGTFGNCLIMPFVIPQDLADQVGIDPAQLQQNLLAYQKEGFVQPHSTVALPTRGVLGEAVLGHCASAEKIDLTRFWNWQDAPADTAPGIGMVQLPTTTPPLTTGMTAPNSLTNLPPLINNLIAPPQPNTSLVQAMGQQATSQPDFSSSFTGQQQLAPLMQNGQTLANSARANALTTAQTSASHAMDVVAGLLGGGSQAAGKAAGTAGTASKAAGAAGATTGAGGTAGAAGAAGSGAAAGAAGATGAAGAAGGASAATALLPLLAAF